MYADADAASDIPTAVSVRSGLGEDRVLGAAAVRSGIGDDRVLGTSTANQVLARWKDFVDANGSSLRELAAHPAEWSRLSVDALPRTQHGAAGEAGTVLSLEEDVQEVLGLRGSAAGCLVCVLAAALREARACVEATPELLRPIELFGELHEAAGGGGSAGGQTPPQIIAEFAELLPDLRRLREHLERISEVAVHLVRQMIGVHLAATARDGKLPGLDRPSVTPLLEALGDLLAVPALVDCILVDNPHMGPAHATYSWIVSKAGAVAEGSANRQLEMPADKAALLGAELQELEGLVNGGAMEFCLGRAATSLQDVGRDCPISALREQLSAYFKGRAREAESSEAACALHLRLPGDVLVPWVCTLVFFARIWKPGSSETRLASDLLKAHRRTPAVVVRGRAAWCLADFLGKHAPRLVGDGSVKPEELRAQRQKQVTRLDDGSFAQEVNKQRAAVQGWLVSLAATVSALESGNVSRALKEAPLVLIRGLGLALRIRASLQEYLILHVREGMPVPRSSLPAVALGFQLLDAVETGPAAPRWQELSVLLQHHLALRLHTQLEDTRRKLGRRATEQLNAQLLTVAINAMYTILGGERAELSDPLFDVGAMALCYGGQAELIAAGSGGHWREFRLLSRWREQLGSLCDTSWCFWVRQLFRDLLVELRDKPRGAAGLPRLCHAFSAALDVQVAIDSDLGRHYVSELRGAIDSALVIATCSVVEEDLRLHTHAVMQATPETLPKAAAARPEVLGALGLRPLRLTPKVLVDIKDEVEMRLSKTFYDLTALAPQLAETYERMRVLALERYGLAILDGRLPSGSLDHGLDVIEIMRNVHQFAAQYSYSLHQQLFIQSSNMGDVKVRTIAMEHIATSIQMHGAGVINTMVNYIYGFLRRKLEVVVEFLNDESVKSRMLTDRQWLSDQRGYTWARAVETARFIRKLGGGRDGVSFLDKLRQVVTQIGNSLGYVRLVRAAGMRCVAGGLPFADAACFGGPRGGRAAGEEDAGDAGSGAWEGFSKAAAAADCPPLIGEAAEAADEAIWSVRRCFEASTDYLNLLAHFFAKALEGLAAAPSGGGAGGMSAPGVVPARLFHLLAPALSESFLHALLVGREALAKRAVTSATTKRTNAFYVDDGFALGLAWILRVFGLEKDFHAMRWFEAEVSEDDLGVQKTTSGGAPFAEGMRGQASASRREHLQQELGRLAATFEASSSLFGSADLSKARAPQPDQADTSAGAAPEGADGAAAGGAEADPQGQ